MKKASMSVDAPHILQEVAGQLEDQGWAAVGLIMGLNAIRSGLVRIAEHAIGLNDPVLLQVLEGLGCVNRKVISERMVRSADIHP
jgi:hypothetical protein